MPQKQKLTRRQYDLLVESFRGAPAEMTRAAQAAGVCRQTAAKFWRHGGTEPWAVPIERVIERERELLRADLEAERKEAEVEQARELGKLDAVRARTDAMRQQIGEAQLSRACRENASVMLELLADLLEGVASLRGELRRAFEDGSIRTLVRTKPSEAIKLLRECTKAVHEGSQAAEVAVKLERLIVGEPTSITGVVIEDEAEAHEIIRRAAAASARRGGTTLPPEPDPSPMH